jgi:hypothetical protein
MRALLVALLLAGCSSTKECQDADLQGMWEGTPVQGNVMTLDLVFAAGGVLSKYLDGALYKGHYSWDPDSSKLTIIDDDACLGSGQAVYTFAIDPDSMCRDAILHVVTDPCPGRMTSLNGIHVAKF